MNHYSKNKIGFIHVNYNNSRLTIECIKSILSQKNNAIIIVIDNASNEIEKSVLVSWKNNNPQHCSNISFIFENKNWGYFGALNIGLRKLKNTINEFQYIVIGNNDLVFDKQFTNELNQVILDDRVQVIAPNIIKTNGVHQNPYSIGRTSKKRMFLYRLLYMNYLFAKIIYKTANILKKEKSQANRNRYNVKQEIFAGHGACYILTQEFFKKNKQLDESIFLMGEEFLISKQVHQTGGIIYYFPELKVIHNEHSTTHAIPSKKTYLYSKNAFSLIKDFMFF